jgi:hypothetical protein
MRTRSDLTDRQFFWSGVAVLIACTLVLLLAL